MKKILMIFASVFVLFPVHAVDFGNGFSISGGVKTGLMMRNSDYGGKLGGIAMNSKYPMTLYFASYENRTRNGEAWLNFNYAHQIENISEFGLQFGLWAHGDLSSFQDSLRLGDHFLWANFFDNRLRFIGGQGGGTPISSGGWINADWLGYNGLRFFWVDPSGFSAGLNFPDPGEEGIKPVNYLTLLKGGISFNTNKWGTSIQFSNNPIYDDTESSLYGGRHRPAEQDPIGIAGNIAIGAEVQNLYGGKGSLAVEGLFTNLGMDEERGRGDYMISPVATTFALKTGYPIMDNFYAEIKGKYTIRQGDSDDLRNQVTWGLFEIEPYVSFKPLNHLTFHFTVYGAFYINSYYLALKPGPLMGQVFDPGQVPGFSPLLDYLSPFRLSLKPKASFDLAGVNVDLGYSGYFSRDHVRNTIYIDFKWSF